MPAFPNQTQNVTQSSRLCNLWKEMTGCPSPPTGRGCLVRRISLVCIFFQPFSDWPMMFCLVWHSICWALEIGSVCPGSPLRDASFLLSYLRVPERVAPAPGTVHPSRRGLFNKSCIPSGVGYCRAGWGTNNWTAAEVWGMAQTNPWSSGWRFWRFFCICFESLKGLCPPTLFFFFCTRAKQDRHTSTHVIHQSTVSPMLLFLSLLCPESNVIVSPVSQMMRVSKSANQSGKFRFYLCSQREGGTLKILYKQDQAVGNIIWRIKVDLQVWFHRCGGIMQQGNPCPCHLLPLPFFPDRSHHVALVGLELAVYIKQTSSSHRASSLPPECWD